MKKLITILFFTILLFTSFSVTHGYFESRQRIEFSFITKDWVPPKLALFKKNEREKIHITEHVKNGQFHEGFKYWQTTGQVVHHPKTKIEMSHVTLETQNKNESNIAQVLPPHPESALHFSYKLETDEDIGLFLDHSFQIFIDNELVYNWQPISGIHNQALQEWQSIVIPIEKKENQSTLTFKLQTHSIQAKSIKVSLANISSEVLLLNKNDSVLFESNESNSTLCFDHTDCQQTPFEKNFTENQKKIHTVVLTDSSGLQTVKNITIVSDIVSPVPLQNILLHYENPNEFTIQAKTQKNNEEMIVLEIGLLNKENDQFLWQELAVYDWKEANEQAHKNNFIPTQEDNILKVVRTEGEVMSFVKLRLKDAAGNVSPETAPMKML